MPTCYAVVDSHKWALLEMCVQEKRAAQAKAQQLQQPQGGSGSTPASGAASPSPMETLPSGGVDRASSDAVAVAAAAMARTKSQGKAILLQQSAFAEVEYVRDTIKT